MKADELAARHDALFHAVQFHKGGNGAHIVVATAEEFLKFLQAKPGATLAPPAAKVEMVKVSAGKAAAQAKAAAEAQWVMRKAQAAYDRNRKRRAQYAADKAKAKP